MGYILEYSHRNDMDIHDHFQAFVQQSMRGIIGVMLQNGLSILQIYTLMYLYHEQEVKISDIGVLMDVGKAAASQLVDRMVDQGLVERVEDPSDRRAKKLKLTPKSLAIIEKGQAAQREHMETVMHNLSPEQLKVVQQAFKYLVDAMHTAHKKSEKKY
jgi:DNA-binding MarR family transcriptional regulator